MTDGKKTREETCEGDMGRRPERIYMETRHGKETWEGEGNTLNGYMRMGDIMTRKTCGVHIPEMGRKLVEERHKERPPYSKRASDGTDRLSCAACTTSDDDGENGTDVTEICHSAVDALTM